MFVRIGATLMAGLCVSMSLSGCDMRDWRWFNRKVGIDGTYACPRPPDPFQTQGFNGQEREIRYYRHLGFANDFFAQLELANRYAAIDASDKNLEDHIRSSVWLVMALANQQGYAPASRAMDRAAASWPRVTTSAAPSSASAPTGCSITSCR